MSDREHLNDMLDNVINDKNEQAAVDFHEYLQAKMREIIQNNTDTQDKE